jgi:DNA (cytosine-5)-methyltransferase 1
MRPRLLDLFCGAGGAAMGYHRAGFDVVGVDILPRPSYPFTFLQGDALEADFAGFDAVHASPPCQRYIRSGNVDRARHPDLLGPTRELLEASGLPWAIENVPGAPMRPDVVLCGSIFGLDVRRHRWFELSTATPVLTLACDHSRPITGVYGNPHGAGGAWRGMLPSDRATWARGLGIDWMDVDELALAIPPAYTELVGALLLAELAVAA